LKKLLVLCALLWTVTATAQTFPNKPVKIITAMPVGSGPDNVMRKMADKLSTQWGVPVIVENKPGGAGAVMYNAYAEEKADGYTLAIADPGVFVAYPILYNKPEVLVDIQPLAGTFLTSFVLATAPTVKDFADLKAKYKNTPVFASTAVGTGMHLQGLELSSFWKIEGNHVPYKEIGLSFVDTSNGLIPFTFTTIASSRQLEAGGKLKYLAVASKNRNPAYLTVPTLAELTGSPITLYQSWNIVYIKKAVPADIKTKIARDISDVMKTPDMQENVKSIGYEPLPGTPADLEKFVNSEIANFMKATKKYKISVQ
jgi:tripartite-type tricarboxylate transporter receptor subunit TctC